MDNITTDVRRKPVTFAQGTDYVVTEFQATDTKGKPAEKHKNYECVHCQFSTVVAANMRDHLVKGDHPYGWPGGGKHPDLDENTAALMPSLTLFEGDLADV
jgi:hypothetical protein